MNYIKTIKLRCIYKEKDIIRDFIKKQNISSGIEIKLDENNIIIEINSKEKINIGNYNIVKNIFDDFNIEYFEIQYSYLNIFKNLYDINLNNFDINLITDNYYKFKIEEIIEDDFSNIYIIKEILKGSSIEFQKCYRLFLQLNCSTEHIIRYMPYRYSFKELENVDNKLIDILNQGIIWK